MEAHLISIIEFCSHYSIESDFIESLAENELIEFVSIGNALYVHEDQLSHLEKLVRLHYDLDINLEGIEVINHMLEKMEHMQTEIRQLKNRLRLLE